MIGGVQQIKAHIDFHTYSELVLWPYGYTTADTAPGLTPTRSRTFAHARPADGAHERLHARAGQSTSTSPTGHHRLDVGDLRDLHLHLRDVPRPAGWRRGFYPPDEQIGRETTRNREAVLLFLEGPTASTR